VLADLVIARIVEPTSLLDAARVLSDLGQPPASYATVKRTLKRVAVPGESSGALTYCEQVARRCFEHARSHGDVSLALYDVTTLYFEAEKEDDLRKGRPTQGTTYARDDLRKVGFSKERRADPQVVVGLLVNRGGFPRRSAASRATRPRRPRSSPPSRHSRPATSSRTWSWSPTPDAVSDEPARARPSPLRFIVGSRVTKDPADLASPLPLAR